MNNRPATQVGNHRRVPIPRPIWKDLKRVEHRKQSQSAEVEGTGAPGRSAALSGRSSSDERGVSERILKRRLRRRKAFPNRAISSASRRRCPCRKWKTDDAARQSVSDDEMRQLADQRAQAVRDCAARSKGHRRSAVYRRGQTVDQRRASESQRQTQPRRFFHEVTAAPPLSQIL